MLYPVTGGELRGRIWVMLINVKGSLSFHVGGAEISVLLRYSKSSQISVVNLNIKAVSL